jgi:DNA-binding XRE family transcriptional regulator
MVSKLLLARCSMFPYGRGMGAPHIDDPADALGWQRALVLALLRPVVRFCRRVRLPLKSLEDLTRLAYFEELRQGGTVPQAEVARLTGVSLRTVGALERQAREGLAATAAERALQRHIEEMLGHESARTAHEIAARFAGEPRETVERMLVALVAEGRLVQQGEQYALDSRYVSLVGPDRAARLDGLNHQLDVLSVAVHGRFLRSERRTLARTLSFQATPEALDALLASLPQSFRAACAEAEEASLDRPGHHTYGATFAIGPMDDDEETPTAPRRATR